MSLYRLPTTDFGNSGFAAHEASWRVQLSKNPAGGCTHPTQPSPTFDFQGFLGHQRSKNRVRQKHQLGRYLLVRSQFGSKLMTALGQKRALGWSCHFSASEFEFADLPGRSMLGKTEHTISVASATASYSCFNSKVLANARNL